jgi:predicted site-specific integrase-resolvase
MLERFRGLNFKRKGLQSLLVRLMRGDKLTIVVACRDQLCQFGFELFEFMAQQNGGSVVVLD